MITTQLTQEVIRYPRYLNGATREGSKALSLDSTAPLPLRDLMFLNKDDEVQGWLLGNDGKHPLNLMVQESHLEEAGDDRSTPEHVGGRHPFFDRNVWDHSGQAEDIVGGTQWDDNDDKQDKDAHIVVRNRRMREQSAEHGDEMEDMDNDEANQGEDGEEDEGEKDMAESERESQMPQERETIVIDVGL